MASSNIPETNLPQIEVIAEAINPSSVTTNGVGPFCTLATGISQPIASSIQSTINTLNSIQGAVDAVVYAPARGLQNLQQRILSGEILNDVTLKIAFSLQSIITNAAKSIATAAVSNALGDLANKVGARVDGVIGDTNNALTQAANQINEVTGNVNRLIEAGNAQLVAGVYKIANYTENAIQGTISNTGTVLNDITKIAGGAVSDITKSAADAINETLTSTVKGVTIPQIKTVTIKTAAEVATQQ